MNDQIHFISSILSTKHQFDNQFDTYRYNLVQTSVTWCEKLRCDLTACYITVMPTDHRNFRCSISKQMNSLSMCIMWPRKSTCCYIFTFLSTFSMFGQVVTHFTWVVFNFIYGTTFMLIITTRKSICTSGQVCGVQCHHRAATISSAGRTKAPEGPLLFLPTFKWGFRLIQVEEETFCFVTLAYHRVLWRRAESELVSKLEATWMVWV